jgi:hypothetical protein
MACEKACLQYGTPGELLEQERTTRGWRFLAKQLSSILYKTYEKHD